MCLRWNTNGIHTGLAGKPRRVRGRTFIVPVGRDTFIAGGALRATDTGRLTTFGNALMATGPAFGIWARHIPAKTGVGAHGDVPGAFFPATSFTLPTKAAVLTSRRD
jgi:hypothetical protein